jgi:predicted ATPase
VGSVPSGTVTFLFTDVEGSTRRWQDDPEAMRALLVEHDAILREVIDEHRGLQFKHTGDGVAAAFASAADACAAAVDAQLRLRDVLPVRMGLHSGEAELRDGDYFGSTLNRCARLMGVAHGGQVLVSAAVAALVREQVALVDLGEHRLRDLSYPEHVWQVGGGAFAPLRSLESFPTNLPLQSSSFVGRVREVEAVAALLVDHRLVTLTGVGGVGKTRLAFEVGAALLPRLADGVWVVELAPLAHDEMVLATIAEAVGVPAQTGESLATTLVSRLMSRQLLVILDNCEHVLNPVARLVDRLTTSAPNVRVLATSRELLGIAAERVQAVPPLAEGTEAIELFIDRATQSGARFDESERQAIAEICVRLDGIPLAIELAAARARMMAPSQIAERLDQRFRLLTGGGRTAVERHRTLRATVSWSYELLDQNERSVFQRLSTLTGSFDLQAAEAIAAGGTVESFEVLDAVGHLVDKSMVVAAPAPSGVRYRLLETMRQFAADHLADQPDGAEVQDRHAAFFGDRAVTLGRATGGTDQNMVLDAIDADIDNYRTAFAHLLSGGRIDDAARAVLALVAYWQIRRTREGLRWQQTILAHPDLDARRRVRALAAVARSEAQVGDRHRSEQHATEAVQLAEAAGVDPPWGAFEALLLAARRRQDAVAYRRWWELGHRVVMAGGDRYLQLLVEAQRGDVPGAWDTDELIEFHERLHREIGQHGDPLLVFVAAHTFAGVLYHAGQTARALDMAHSAIEPGRRAGPLSHSVALLTAAAVDALTEGIDHTQARATAGESIRIARDEGLTSQLLPVVFVAAAIAARRDDIERAAVLLAAAARHADPTGIGGDYLSRACRAEAQTAVDAYSGDLTAARHQGAAVTLDELTTYTLATLD